MTPADDGFLVCVRLTLPGQIQVMIQKRGEGGDWAPKLGR
jgi:hypothetical protein